MDPETIVCISYLLLYWELPILGGAEVGRCSVLLAGLAQNLDKIQLLYPRGSPQRIVTQLRPAIAGRINPPPRRAACMGGDLPISTAPMGKLLLCKINLNKGLPCVTLLHSTMCINKISLFNKGICL